MESSDSLYKRAKHNVTKIVLKAKSLYYNQKISAASSSKELYKITNNLLARSKSTPLPTLYPFSSLPDIFCNFFSDKIKTIRHQLDSETSSNSLPESTPFNGFPFLTFEPVTERDVKSVILKSAPKSCALDPVPTHLLIECLDAVLPSLTALFNSSLTSGIFPQEFKSALVSPLLKKATLDQNLLKNYRPVSNLSFISKILEKLVLTQLSDHLSLNNLLNSNQSAYRPGHSTETALLKIFNDLLLAVDNGNVSVLALLDLSAAFDTIDHFTLINRLQHNFGFGGTVLNWFSSYLTGRTFSVSINSQTSAAAPLTCGVPQGSVLGPILFVLYTTPLASVIDNHSVIFHSYADDTQLYKSSPPDHLPELLQSIEACTSDIKSWMTLNKLKLNEEKTEVMIVSSSRKSTSTNFPNFLSIGNASVSFSHSVKNLGVTLDCHLTMQAHVLNVVRAANFELRRISSIRHLLSTYATVTLISAFVLSRLDYCNSLLSGCPQSLISQLQRVQNNAVRLILKLSKSDHISHHLASLHWLPVAARIQYEISTLVFNTLRFNSPLYLSNLLSLYIPARSLRSSADKTILNTPSVRTVGFGHRSFSHSAPTIWNSLPLSVRSSDSVSSFKTSVKTHLFKASNNTV